MSPKTWLERGLLAFLVLFLTLAVLQKINLTTADLGRHIKNGELVITKGIIPNTNLYSFTYPDFPFVNHHWGTGVVFYLIYEIGGFAALTLLFLIITLFTFYIFFHIAWKYSSFWLASTTALIALPLIATRIEIRPEAFSYLFIAVFFWVLWNYQNNRLKARHLFWLPLLTLIWVNMHVYFFFGLAMMGVFIVENLFNVVKIKSKESGINLQWLGITLGISAVATLLNPFGITGALYPTKIFSNYGYRLLENQSVHFLDRIMQYPPSLYMKVVLVMLLVSIGYVVYRIATRKEGAHVSLLILALTFTVIGWMAVRNFTIFGYFAFVCSAIFLSPWKVPGMGETKIHPLYPTLFAMLFLTLMFINPAFWSGRGNIGVGLEKGNDQAAKFFIENKIKGPVFNNYDIGGYLIFYLYPSEQVFVDNRPEAYPATFFEKTYIPMQENETKWKEIDEKYKFNSIFFYRQDLTPWAQKFLIAKVKELEWAPVYVDTWHIIFVRRTPQNEQTIRQYELPKEMFGLK